MKFLIDHPSLLLWAFPFVLTGAVAGLGRLEKNALARLFSAGDATDQQAIRAIVGAVVKWAEKKSAPNADGTAKFATVDRLLGRALPFLSADERHQLIQKAVDEMDKDAEAALNGPPAAP